ncbi:hypothetical protein MHBO_004166 [Bonamia ostreae]|uniref:Uncharacterized protein n=1 Tax=Bonamia ostreae TaxID=126728 RepID=A0ABV2ASM9_9EUKA
MIKPKKILSKRIYETETTSLVGGETLQIPRVANFEWCPASSFLAFRCDPDNERRVKLGTLAVPSLQQRIASIYHGNPRLRISWDCDRLVSDVHTYTHKNRPKHVSFDFFDYKQSFGAKNAHFALTEKILHILKAGRTEEFPMLFYFQKIIDQKFY